MRKGTGSVKESGSHVEVKTEGSTCEYQCREELFAIMTFVSLDP